MRILFSVFLTVPALTEAFFTAPVFATNVPGKSNAIIDAPKKTIAVTGATGRTGALLVQELLDRGNNVVAMVRDEAKAKETLPNPDGDNLKIVKCDLSSENDIISTVNGNNCDAAIWCATGFSDNPTQSFFEKIAGVFGVALAPNKSIDAVGVPALAKAFETSEKSDGDGAPKVIMLSSAGVTRPSWDEEKKKMFEGAADIPIVRLNPFNILNIKADSEERLRESGVPYAIFRPTGLNDKWQEGARPVFSQGDVAVGRINRKDVATILADCVNTKEAAGKTFEAFTVEGYSPAPSISTALGRLSLDDKGPISNDVLYATYSNMQQLLPGEKQDAAALAMGQTYEQLDGGETGRLGERGKENAEAAAPKPTSTSSIN